MYVCTNGGKQKIGENLNCVMRCTRYSRGLTENMKWNDYYYYQTTLYLFNPFGVDEEEDKEGLLSWLESKGFTQAIHEITGFEDGMSKAGNACQCRLTEESETEIVAQFKECAEFLQETKTLITEGSIVVENPWDDTNISLCVLLKAADDRIAQGFSLF
jgi:uncharacterized LabA/DUF88 family protein